MKRAFFLFLPVLCDFTEFTVITILARYDHEQMVWLSLEGQDELSVVTDQALGGPEKGRLIFMNILDYSLFFSLGILGVFVWLVSDPSFLSDS